VGQRQTQILEDLQKARGSVQQTLEMLSGVIAPVVVFACAVWIGLLALANVRERRAEIGLLRALGKGSGTIAVLFLGKAVLLGLLGAAIGFGLGTGLAYALGTRVLELAAGQLPLLRVPLLAYALVGAPLVCAVASYLPTLSAIIQDPAVVLRDA
jgi:putative ABC transport system permease protein